MKTTVLLFVALLSLASCHKELLGPAGTPLFNAKGVVGAQNDTVPDKAAVRIKVSKDSINANETLLVFDRSASPDYFGNEDAEYLAGFGQVNIASISKDDRDLSINRLPYSPGMTIDLDVYTKKAGMFTFSVSYENKMPGDVQIWLKDNCRKDSVNICTSNYSFNVNKADSTSFGKKRFQLVFRRRAFVQTATPN